MLLSFHSRAEPPEGKPPAEGARRVEITLVGQVGQVGGLGRLLTEWLARDESRVELRYEPTLGREQVLGSATDTQTLRIWVLLINSHQARLYFADPAGQRFLLRDVPLRDGLDELGRERLAQVLVTSAQAFVEQRASTSAAEVARTFEPPVASGGRLGDFGENREGEKVASRPERPLEPRVPPRAARSVLSAGSQGSPARTSRVGTDTRRSPWFGRLGVLYGVAYRGDEGLGHGPGVLVGGGYRRRGVSWGAKATGQYHVPVKPQGDFTIVKVSAYALRLSGVMERPWGRHLAWGAEIGGGVDWAKFEVESRPNTHLTLREAQGQDWRPVALAAWRGSLGRSNLKLALALGVTIHFDLTSYEVEVASQTYQADIKSWLVHPSATLEASWQ